jgi:hypothetical protein
MNRITFRLSQGMRDGIADLQDGLRLLLDRNFFIFGETDRRAYSAGQSLPPTPTSYNDLPRVGLQHPGDGRAMGTYSEEYQYDQVGNFIQVNHRGMDPADPGWTRGAALEVLVGFGSRQVTPLIWIRLGLSFTEA